MLLHIATIQLCTLRRMQQLLSRSEQIHSRLTSLPPPTPGPPQEGRRPSSPALWWVSEQGTQVKWSFEELALESKKAATLLSERGGLRQGDRVVVILPRIPEWWLLNLACIRTGEKERCPPTHEFLIEWRRRR